MTDLIYDFITQGIDLMIVGAVLMAMVTLLMTANRFTAVVSTNDSMNDRIAKVKEYNQYDGQTVSAEEVASAVMKYATSYENYDIVIQSSATYVCTANSLGGINTVKVNGNDSINNSCTVMDTNGMDHIGNIIANLSLSSNKYKAYLITNKTISGNTVTYDETSAASSDVITGIYFICIP